MFAGSWDVGGRKGGERWPGQAEAGIHSLMSGELMGCGLPSMLTCMKEFGARWFPKGQRRETGGGSVASPLPTFPLPCGLEPLSHEKVESAQLWAPRPGVQSSGPTPLPPQARQFRATFPVRLSKHSATAHKASRAL